MKIACVDETVQRLLMRGFFKIPRFQRPYSWDQENLEEFWNDTILGSNEDYFIGSMVLFKVPDGTFGVVDGQQRISTITIILAATRNIFAKISEESLANGIQTLIERFDINNKKQFVLQTETSYPYFQEHIQKFGSPETPVAASAEERNLEAAYEFFYEKISQRAGIDSDSVPISRDRKIQELQAIRDKILNLKLIYIEIDDEDDAYMVFETLNTRGKDLSVADLIRTSLTSGLRPANIGVDLVKERWFNIVETLDDSEQGLQIEDYLLHFWLSRFEFTTLKQLYKKFKRNIKKDDLKNFFDELCADGKRYCEIQNTDWRQWTLEESDVRDSLDALSLFRVRLHLPLTLAVWRDYELKNLRLKHVQDMLTAIEKFHFQFTAITSKRSSGGISMMYANHARELFKSSTIQEKLGELMELKKKLKSKLPTEAQFVAGFQRLRYSEKFPRDKKLVKYVLSKLDAARRKGSVAKYEEMTIEHIMPQSDSSTSAEKIAEIGNLILVDADTNSRLETRPFQEKMEILKDVGYPIDVILGQSVFWGEGTISERSRVLARQAYAKIWAF